MSCGTKGFGLQNQNQQKELLQKSCNQQITVTIKAIHHWWDSSLRAQRVFVSNQSFELLSHNITIVL
jgi:hypothetical protein